MRHEDIRRKADNNHKDIPQAKIVVVRAVKKDRNARLSGRWSHHKKLS